SQEDRDIISYKFNTSNRTSTKNTIADYKCVYQYSLIQNRRNILLATITFNCPICENQMKQIHLGKVGKH
ncbi:MAG: hypothetical protein ACJ72S_13605, partial [Nitrososphaeraceae archaeon]